MVGWSQVSQCGVGSVSSLPALKPMCFSDCSEHADLPLPARWRSHGSEQLWVRVYPSTRPLPRLLGYPDSPSSPPPTYNSLWG